MDSILTGAYDLHIHTSPDVVPRRCTDEELAERLSRCKMAGFAIKCHFSETAARAAILQAKYPGMKIVGGITLNRQAGGINPNAVERAAMLGAKFVWFPTLEAFGYQKYHHRNDPDADLSMYIRILDSEGKLISAVDDVLDVANAYHMVVATGHIGAEEGIALVAEARKKGIKKIVVTHADNPATYYSVSQQKRCAQMGAMIEHSYFTMAKGYTTAAKMKQQIEAVGSENVYLSTDLGQTCFDYPDVGLADYAKQLLQAGVSISDLGKMMKQNPAELLRD